MSSAGTSVRAAYAHRGFLVGVPDRHHLDLLWPLRRLECHDVTWPVACQGEPHRAARRQRVLIHDRHLAGDRGHPQVNELSIREAQRYLGAVRQCARYLGLGSPTVQMPVDFGDPVVDCGQLVGKGNLVRRISVDKVTDRITHAVKVGRHALAPPLQSFQLRLEKGGSAGVSAALLCLLTPRPRSTPGGGWSRAAADGCSWVHAPS